jgi:ABC-2 type transport system ATP-binding protein
MGNWLLTRFQLIFKKEKSTFLGLNGAGKTTTIRMLLTYFQPTSSFLNGIKVSPGNTDVERCWHLLRFLFVSRSYCQENLEIIRHLRFIKILNQKMKLSRN